MTVAIQPTSTTIEVAGRRMHYLAWGSDSAPPVVLLHGLTGCADHWQRVAEHLAARYRVVALDQRGHGDSDRADATAYRTDDFVADLDAFVDALHFERFILIGHSMGGHNTIAFTARHPERIVCAIANDIPPSYERDPAAAAQQYPNGQHAVLPDVEAWIAAQRESSPFATDEGLRLSATRLREVAGGVQLRSDPNVSIHWAPQDLWDEARTITRPILFVRGGASTVLEAATLQRMDMEIAPARSVTLEKSGHNTFLDMEAEFLDVISEFLGAHSG